jgi:hypothetical protein
MAHITGFDMFNRLPKNGSGSSASFTDLDASVDSIRVHVNPFRGCSTGRVVECIAGQRGITADFKRDIGNNAIAYGAQI